MNNTFEGLAIACIYMFIIFAPLGALTFFSEHTRLGRRIMDKILRRMHVLDDEPNYVTFRANGYDTQVNLDEMSLEDLRRLSSWIEESISKK